MKRIVLMVITLSAFLFSIPIATLESACYPPSNNPPCKGNFDFDCDQDGTDAFVFKSDFGRSTLLNPCLPDGPAPVSVTGQTMIYAERDDGDFLQGIAWPSPRFTDNGNGTITDNLTGLFWLKNANCFGTRTWDQALADAGALADGLCGLTDGSDAGSWRLPNVRELLSLIDFGKNGPGLPSGHPFTNVESMSYWTSTTSPLTAANAYYVGLNFGYVVTGDKTGSAYVWPVCWGR